VDEEIEGKCFENFSFEEMQDLISGATILGCGGGGDPMMSKSHGGRSI